VPADYYYLVMPFIQNYDSVFLYDIKFLKESKNDVLFKLFLSPKPCYRTRGHGVHELCV
jgi:hypothetical protein